MKARVIIAVITLGSSVTFADKLSDFRDADRADEGCVTIPAKIKVVVA